MSKRKTKHLLAARMPDGQVVVVDTKKKVYLWYCYDVHDTVKSLEVMGVGLPTNAFVMRTILRNTRICF
jgi:hypothetical protein